MKFDTMTIQILKNFSAINQNILVKPGNKLRTISPTRAVLAQAIVEQEFTEQFAIHDLPRLLGTISLFDNPELTIDGRSMKISEGNTKFNYVLSDESIILAAPDKEVNVSDPYVEFTLTDVTLSKVLRALSVASLPELAVSGQDGKIYVQAIDSKGPMSDTFSVEVGETNKTFRAVYRAENIKFVPGDYEVSITSRGISHFKGKNVEYFVAVESNSTF